MLIEACLLKGFVFYRCLLKLPQERQEDTVASNLPPELRSFLSVSLTLLHLIKA